MYIKSSIKSSICDITDINCSFYFYSLKLRGSVRSKLTKLFHVSLYQILIDFRLYNILLKKKWKIISQEKETLLMLVISFNYIPIDWIFLGFKAISYLNSISLYILLLQINFCSLCHFDNLIHHLDKRTTTTLQINCY